MAMIRNECYDKKRHCILWMDEHGLVAFQSRCRFDTTAVFEIGSLA